MFYVAKLRHEKNTAIKAYVGDSVWQTTDACNATTPTQECKESAGCKKPFSMKTSSSTHEIEILRRILFALTTEQLQSAREHFCETPELFGEDQECIDMIDWAMKRREML